MKASRQKKKRGQGRWIRPRWGRWRRKRKRKKRKKRRKIRERRSVCEGWPVWQRNADRTPLCLSLHGLSELLYAWPTLSLCCGHTVSPKLYHCATLRPVPHSYHNALQCSVQVLFRYCGDTVTHTSHWYSRYVVREQQAFDFFVSGRWEVANYL